MQMCSSIVRCARLHRSGGRVSWKQSEQALGMRAPVSGAITCAILATVFSSARGQQPASAVKAAAAPKVWKAAVDLGFNAASGNSSLTYWHSALTLTRLPSALAEFEWNI